MARFSKENQPTKRRSKGILNILAETVGREYKLELKANDIVDYTQYLLECTEDEVSNVIADKDQPMLAKIVANKLTNKKYNYAVYEKILERLLQRDGLQMNGNNKISITFGE